MIAKRRSVSRSNLILARVTAIRAHALGEKSIDIAKMLGVHEVTVSRWIRLYRERGALGLKVKKLPGRPRKVDCNAVSRRLLGIVKRSATDFGFEHPLWTTSRLREVLRKEMGIQLGLMTVWRELKRIGLSSQKPVKRALEADEKSRTEWFKKTWPKIRRQAKKQRAVILFEDESTVQLTPNLGKTWAKIGRPPVVKVTAKKASVGVISAISESGKLLFKIPKKRVNSAVFITFLKQVLNEIPRKQIFMILDNGPAHKSKKTLNFVNSNTRLKMFFLPPYSPDFNPDEMVWNQLKNVEMKAHGEKNKDGLIRKTRNKMKSIQKKPKLIKNFYKKVFLT
jgi:transposase